MKFYKCGVEGHFQSNYKNPLMCYNHKREGHVSTQCPEGRRKELCLYGFGILGQRFYSMDVDVGVFKQRSGRGVGALITVVQGDNLSMIMEAELQ